jgi:hypothetical protein
VTNANDIAALVDRLRIWGEGADNQPDEDCLLAAAALTAQARRIAELERDIEVMWGWGDPCDMAVADEVVWRKYQHPEHGMFNRAALSSGKEPT